MGEKRSWVLLVLDSCRYDAMIAAAPRHLNALGTVHRRYSYASWTAPAHYHLLMGLLPHPATRETHAAEIYRENYHLFNERLGIDLGMSDLVPDLWLPSLLQRRGWATGAWVSMPVLHPSTPLSRGFDTYRLRNNHADLQGIIEDLRFYDDRPTFWLINAGETHYPYAFPGQSAPPVPHLSGVHGALRRIDEHPAPELWFTGEQLADLKERQVEAVRYVDSLIPLLRALVPKNTWLTVTADHGECFGEDGFFGHGPVLHPKVWEVPLVEGLLK